MADQSKAMLAVCSYVSKVASEVRDRLEAGKVPNPDQLSKYVQQVVDQLQKLVKGAPRNIQDKMAGPFHGFYDFWGNKTNKPLSAQSFLGILEDLEDVFPVPANGDGDAGEVEASSVYLPTQIRQVKKGSPKREAAVAPLAEPSGLRDWVPLTFVLLEHSKTSVSYQTFMVAEPLWLQNRSGDLYC
ncbi:unnamed protein product [Symbiodinium sp. CCMP2592]|nr:unnamed protein product [Symbiodinium sp. CCMP2592]